MPVLALNAGSSSLKFAVFDGATAILRGQVAGIDGTPDVTVRAGGKKLPPPSLPGGSQDALMPGLLDWIDAHAPIDAAGHRIVHGGTRFAEPVRVDDGVMAALDAMRELAPLHLPHSLAGVRAVAAARPGLAQVACFDTAFHRSMPDEAARLPIPRALHDAGVRRFGFHGLSYEWIAGRLVELDPTLATGRVVVAHLGSGASLCALHGGRSVGTTMSFTALDGLMMATRCGSLDPGVLLYLMQARGMTASALEDMLYHQSGLLGVSGVSGDMRVLTASDDPAAAQALALFRHRLLQEIASLIPGLGGLDGLVFTAGIGEHDAALRAACCEGLAWLGVNLNQSVNQSVAGSEQATAISDSQSRVKVWVIPTDEEAVISRHTQAVLSRG